MRKVSLLFLALSLVIFLPFTYTADKVKEDSTDLLFDKIIKFSSEADSPNVICTGTGVRKKAIFKVYGAALYVEVSGAKKVLGKYMPKTPPEDIEDFGEELAENPTFWNDFASGDFHKVMVMRFVRDVGADSIVGAYKEGFEKNCKDKSEQTKKDFAVFLGFFTDEIKEGQDMTLRIAPDGTIYVDYAGKYRGNIKNANIAKALLLNWFGNDPISDDIKEGGSIYMPEVLK